MNGSHCSCTLSGNCGDCTCFGDCPFIGLKLILGGIGAGFVLMC